MSIEQLKAKPQSVPRNPLIARIFYLASYIEQYGSGIQRILTSFADAGLPEPEFQTDAWRLTLTMHKDLFSEEYLTEHGFSERQINGLLYIREHGKISNKEYQQINDVSAGSALNDLRALVHQGILKRHGTGQKSRYVLKNTPAGSDTRKEPDTGHKPRNTGI